MLARLLRGLLYLVYGLVVLTTFGLAAYVSFSLFVRSGVTTVPAVRGLSRAEATAALTDQGLRLRASGDSGRYDNEVPIGHVVRQVPDARTIVKRGSGVQVILSLGPQRVEVPELLGTNLPAAQAALSGAGLALGKLLGAFAPDAQEGSVIGQDPDPGDAVAPASPVDMLLVMTVQRERYIMPDLVYRNYELVRPYFEQYGFRLGTVKYERYEGVAAGVILRQFPLPGHPFTKQEPISLVVATAEGLDDDPLGELATEPVP
jgi:serine/threonine-protein kinase